MATYNFEVGETVRVPLLLLEGNKDIITNVRAVLKETTGPKKIKTSDPGVPFTVINANDGWILELPASVTRNLKEITYAFNAAMEVGGYTEISEVSYIVFKLSTVV